MARCDVCGNAYDKPMAITYEGRTRSFDSLACAIQALAPCRCASCGWRVIGRGVEERGKIFCCASCARQAGITEV